MSGIHTFDVAHSWDACFSLPEILSQIIAFIPNHLLYRQVCKSFDAAVQYLHSSLNESNSCKVPCIGHTVRRDFIVRSSQIPWLKSWMIQLHVLEELKCLPTSLFEDQQVVEVTPDSIALTIRVLDDQIPLKDLLSFFSLVENSSSALDSIAIRLDLLDSIVCLSYFDVLELSQCPWLRFVSSLELYFDPPDLPSSPSSFEAFITSPHASNIRSFSFGKELSTTDIELLVSSPLLPQLTSLSIVDIFSDDWTSILLSSPNICHLQALKLPIYAPTLTTHSLQIISSSPFASNLTSLYFSSDVAAEDHIRTFCYSKYMSKLKHLTLNTSFQENVLTTLLASSPFITNLVSLELNKTMIPLDRIS